GDREAEEAHGLLPVDHRDDARPAPAFEAADRASPLELEKALLVERDEELSDEEEPQEPGQIGHYASPRARPRVVLPAGRVNASRGGAVRTAGGTTRPARRVPLREPEVGGATVLPHAGRV